MCRLCDQPTIASQEFATVPANFEEFRAIPEQFIDAGEHVVVVGPSRARLRVAPPSSRVLRDVMGVLTMSLLNPIAKPLSSDLIRRLGRLLAGHGSSSSNQAVAFGRTVSGGDSHETGE